MNSLKRNPRIISSPIVLFLGAGASFALGYKTAQSFLAVAENELSDKRWRQVKAVMDVLSSNRNLAFDDPPNIEDVLLTLNEWRLSTFLLTKSRFPKIISLGISQQMYEVLKSANREVDSIRKDLLEVLAHHYSSCDPIIAFNHYNWLFKLLFTYSRHIPIFSTNYDWSIELSSEDKAPNKRHYLIIDGFQFMGGDFEPTLFNLDVPNSMPTIWLFRLHGSSAWYWLLGYGFTRRFVYIDTRKTSGMHRVMIHPGGQNLDWYFYTDREYVDRPLRNVNPFRTMYSYLFQCLLNTKLCLVIGYSFPFRDEQIREAFLEALTINENLYILCIDPMQSPFSRSPKTHLISKLSDSTGLHGVDYKINPDRIEVVNAFFGINEYKENIQNAIETAIQNLDIKKNAGGQENSIRDHI
jgi:hypothetical protein